MVDELIVFLPRKETTKIKSVDLTTAQPLRDIFLDYIFIMYHKDRQGLDLLDEKLEDQDEWFELHNKEYTQDHIDTLYDKSKATLDDIRNDDLGELLTGTYEKYRIEVPKGVIKWATLFDVDVEDAERLKVSDVFVEEKTSPLTGKKDAKVRQLMQRIAEGEGLSDANILQRIKEKGELVEIGEKAAGRIGYEIRVPVIPAEDPLSNQKILRNAGIKFASRNIENPKKITGKTQKYDWPIPIGVWKKIIGDKDEKATDEDELFMMLADALHENFPVDLILGDYKEVRNINDLNLYFTFYKGPFFKNLGISNWTELDETQNKINIPLKITYDYSTHAKLELELGGKVLKGKGSAQIKENLESLKEQLEDVDLDFEEQKNLEEQVKELEKDLEEATELEEDAKEHEEAKRKDISTEEGEVIEGEEELEEGKEPKTINVSSDIFPELEKYFRLIRARINDLEDAINEIKNQEIHEV